MTKEGKFFIGVGVLTLLIIVGAAIFLSGAPQQTESTTVADAKTLIKGDSHATNPKGAKVTIVEFGDYQCPACGSAHPVIKKLLGDYKEKITVVFRNFPLDSVHKNAQIGAEAAESAAVQGKFWEMHDMLYERQSEWSELDKPQDLLVTYAKELKLDTNKFKEDLEKKTYATKIKADYDDGIRLGINSTPTFFINGKLQTSGWSEKGFKKVIDAELKK